MAEFVGAFAASHAPNLGRYWDEFPAPLRERLARAYRAVGARIEAVRPDVLIVVSPDHWVNFFLDNLPAVCIGVGEENDGPPEPFMQAFQRLVPGAPALGMHLLQHALAHDFEPALSHRLILDHGFCLPLQKMELKALPAILPIVINSLEPPMMSLNRCAEWGRTIVEAIRSFPGDQRVAILATGGLSHSIGEASMGLIEADMDRRIIELLEAGEVAPLVDYLEQRLKTAGNGGHELRNWVVAQSAAGGKGFELIDYFPVEPVYVGCAWAAWNVN
jgi:aromatic ring-opening dioxygenase catalytic subunit (LigB family)